MMGDGRNRAYISPHLRKVGTEPYEKYGLIHLLQLTKEGGTASCCCIPSIHIPFLRSERQARLFFITVDQCALDFADLQRRITARLQDKGPANVETLAAELNTPQPKVWFALEKLRESGIHLVESRPDGTWDLVGVYRKKKEGPAE